MKKWQDQPKPDPVEELRIALNDLNMPAEGFSSRVMQQLEQIDAQPGKEAPFSVPRKRTARTVAIAASVAAAVSLGVVGSGFVSPVMASALQHLPVIGNVFADDTYDRGIQRAVEMGYAQTPNLTVTRGDFTFTVTDVLYDGTRLNLAIEQEGAKKESIMAPLSSQAHKEDPNDPKGKIYGFNLYINGERIPSNEGAFGDEVTRLGSFSAEFYRLSEDLGEEFTLTAELDVTGVDGAFVFEIPVRKATESIAKWAPNQSQASNGFEYTVRSLEMTPITSRLIVDSTGLAPTDEANTVTKMYYELVNQQGEAIEQKKIGFYDEAPKTAYSEDELFEPFNELPTSVTVRPYSYVLGENGKILKDEQGERVKEYYPELEMTLELPNS